MRRNGSAWRGVSALLLAFILVQADAYPALEAVKRFNEQRVLPVAERFEPQLRQWFCRIADEIELRYASPIQLARLCARG
jgi:hypothetical protein